MNLASKISIDIWPALLALLIPITAMQVEHRLFPVVRDFTITEMRVDHNTLHISGYMRKVRDCTFAGVTAEGMSFAGSEELPITYRDNLNGDSATRPEGLQGWGPWNIEVPIQHQLDLVKLTAVHSCHPAWMTQTNLVTIPVGEIR